MCACVRVCVCVCVCVCACGQQHRGGGRVSGLTGQQVGSKHTHSFPCHGAVSRRHIATDTSAGRQVAHYTVWERDVLPATPHTIGGRLGGHTLRLPAPVHCSELIISKAFDRLVFLKCILSNALIGRNPMAVNCHGSSTYLLQCVVV